MALTTFYTPRYRAVDANGDPLPNAYLQFFEAGTSTPLPVYADVNGNSSLGVEVTSDADGLFAELFMLPQAYDIDLYDEDDNLIWSAVDWFPPAAASAGAVDVTATAGVTFSAGELGYISDGSGALNQGQMYKADADLGYASASPLCYFATTAVSAGEEGVFREAGALSGFSGLTPGSVYYASGTAGAIATTAGTFARVVGQALSTTELLVATNPPQVSDVDARHAFDGRLTLTSGTPVTTADVTAAGTLYLALYQGNAFGLYTGTRWVVLQLAQLSIAVPAVATQTYDVFLDYNDGTPILALTAWTNDTTRATALTTQDGILVKTGDTQQRYVGTVRTVAASQLNDSFALRHVWNYYNRVDRPMRVVESQDSWPYTLATLRQANANVANQLDFVVGVAEDAIEASVLANASNTDPGVLIISAIGLDSTSAAATGCLMGRTTFPAANYVEMQTASLRFLPTVGRHVLVWLEYSSAGLGTTTWFGDGGAPTITQSGIHGVIRG